MLRIISSVGPGDVAHEEGAVDVVRRSGKELREDVGVGPKIQLGPINSNWR